ncbi:hypothetical protein AB0300_16130 [Microbacterium sp. NPDC078814]|uniref:hypothetical protein n=1 Tax=Microbacterium sp. NPDC078814 TaxID=3154767 RepID=UPI00344B3E6F
MSAEQPVSAQQRQALAAIEEGHALERQQLAPRSIDRARRILIGDLRPDARAEMTEDLRAILDTDRLPASR